LPVTRDVLPEAAATHDPAWKAVAGLDIHLLSDLRPKRGA